MFAKIWKQTRKFKKKLKKNRLDDLENLQEIEKRYENIIESMPKNHQSFFNRMLGIDKNVIVHQKRDYKYVKNAKDQRQKNNVPQG